jgi:hypothetical protein
MAAAAIRNSKTVLQNDLAYSVSMKPFKKEWRSFSSINLNIKGVTKKINVCQGNQLFAEWK